MHFATTEHSTIPAASTHIPSPHRLGDDVPSATRATKPLDPRNQAEQPSGRQGNGFLWLEKLCRQVRAEAQSETSGRPGRRRSARMASNVTIIDGPGCGEAFELTDFVTTIGRDDDQDIQLNFGDGYISRFEHAIIIHDVQRKSVRVRDGGRINPVYVNGKALRGEQELSDGDRLRFGHTTLKVDISGK
jgi:hypothetical protein